MNIIFHHTSLLNQHKFWQEIVGAQYNTVFFSSHNETVQQRYWVIDGTESTDRYFENPTLNKQHEQKAQL